MKGEEILNELSQDISDENGARPIPSRSAFRFFSSIQTRWSDNDMLGHLNNVIYNRFFEATIIAFYRSMVPYDVHQQPIVPFVAEALTRLRRPLSFPDTVESGLVIGHLGRSSLRYDLGLFRNGEDMASAHGHLVHVFVDRKTQRPAPIPDTLRAVFTAHMVLPQT